MPRRCFTNNSIFRLEAHCSVCDLYWLLKQAIKSPWEPRNKMVINFLPICFTAKTLFPDIDLLGVSPRENGRLSWIIFVCTWLNGKWGGGRRIRLANIFKTCGLQLSYKSNNQQQLLCGSLFLSHGCHFISLWFQECHVNRELLQVSHWYIGVNN